MSQSEDRSAMGSPKLPKLRHGVFSSAPNLQKDAGAGRLRVDCSAPPAVADGQMAPTVTPSPAGGGWMSSSKEKYASFDGNNKRIGVDGTSKTPSLALLKPTASSIGHRVARVADSFSFQYSYTLPNKNMDISPMKSICTPSHQQQGGIDNNEASETMSMDSPFHKQPIDPFRNIYLHDDESFDNKETISTSHQHYYNTHHSPPKRPLDHSPFPTPHVRRQSEPAVVKSTFYESRERIHQRNQVLDPVASQLLDQEETFVSHSSFLEEDPPLDSTACGDLDNVDRSYVRQHSLPNLSSPQDSPMPLFRKVSSSLHDVKTEDDLSLLARPVPRKLS